MFVEYGGDEVLGIFNHVENTDLNSFLKISFISLVFLSKLSKKRVSVMSCTCKAT